jgi:hypothetical protein
LADQHSHAECNRYMFDTCCPYTVLSDSLNHRAMIWEKSPNWSTTSGSSFDIAGACSESEYIRGMVHRCQVINASNVFATNSWPARYTLAFLCYLALRDHGLCAWGT